MSGHYATLLRGTVAAMLPEHDVYITDWSDAREVPLSMGHFDLDDYIDYVIDFDPLHRHQHPCDRGLPARACRCWRPPALMAAADDPCRPASLMLMGCPIDTSRNPTAVNELRRRRAASTWFEQNVIEHVPWPNAGFMRPRLSGLPAAHRLHAA